MALKRVVIETSDILDEVVAIENSERYSEMNEEEKLNHMVSTREQLDGRFEEFFALVFTLFRATQFKGVMELASADEAHEDFRKQWRIRRFLKSLDGYPAERENAQKQKVPEKVIPISQMKVNSKKFEFDIDSNSVNQAINILEEAIKDPSKLQQESQQLLRGTWFRKHLEALKNAEAVKDGQSETK